MNGRTVFAGLVDRETVTPLTIGMTTPKWLAVPIRAVQVRDLIATQDGVYLKPLLHPEMPYGGDMYPHVVGWRGKLYLEDGHHRALRALIEGRQMLFVRILYVD